MAKLTAAGSTFGEAYKIAHAAALLRYGVSQFSVYHPGVLAEFAQWFNETWFNFCGM